MKKIAIAAAIILTVIGCKKESEIKPDFTETPLELSDEELTKMRENRKSNAEIAPFEDQEESKIAEAKSKPSTTLALSEKNHDFKNVKKGEVVEHRYELTNTGKNPLIISAVKPGCGCTVPDYSKEPILPGQKGYVNLKFDSSSFPAGTVSKYADVFVNVEDTPLKLTFNATVVE